MSTFQPGMANPSAPIFEVDTDIVTYTPTSTGLTYPDVIPAGPANISYETMPVPLDPQPLLGVTSRLFSVICIVSASAVGNGKGLIVFRLGQAAPNPTDFQYEVPMSPLLNSDQDPNSYLISFTGLVKSLPGQIPKLYIEKTATTDTTTYNVESLIIKSKTL